MNIEKTDGPIRYWVHFPERKEGILFQMEMENPHTLKNDYLIIGRVKDSNKPAGKLRIMWSGEAVEFVEEFAGETEPNEFNMMNAITKYIHECYFYK